MFIIFGIENAWHPAGGAFDFVELVDVSDENVAINKANEYYHLPSQKYKSVHVLDIIKTKNHRNGKKIIIWNSETEERKLRQEISKKSEDLKCSNYLEKKKQSLLKNEIIKDNEIVNEIIDSSQSQLVYNINYDINPEKRLYD